MEEMRDLQKPLTLADSYKRSRVIGDEIVSIQYVAGGSYCNVTTRGPEGTSSRNHRFESDALRDFAGRVVELQRQAEEIGPGDTVVRTAEPDGPRGTVESIYRGFDGERMWARVRWGCMLNGHGSPVDTLTKVTDEPNADELMAEELARPLRDAVRAHVAGGGEQFLDMLVARAEDAAILADKVKALCDTADRRRDSESRHDREGYILQDLIAGLRAAIGERS